MDLSKLTYSKKEAWKVVATPAQMPTTERKKEHATSEVLNISSAYQKQDGVFSTSLVFVISGGEKKERDFLYELIKQRQLHSLKVAFKSKDGQGLHPYQMQKEWEKIQNDKLVAIDGQTYHLKSMDKIFLLSDVDEYYSQLEKIFMNHSIDDRGQWIVSNPCFEIWLYYCYLNQPEKDLQVLASLPETKRSQEMKSKAATLVSGGMNPRLAFEKMEEGIRHSKDHYAVDSNGIPVLFATQMHELAQYLVDTMNNRLNEYTEYVKRQKERRIRMKK